MSGESTLRPSQAIFRPQVGIELRRDSYRSHKAVEVRERVHWTPGARLGEGHFCAISSILTVATLPDTGCFNAFYV